MPTSLRKNTRRTTTAGSHSTRSSRASRRPSTPKTVLVFGVFDILHPGHFKFLAEARRHGGRLVVVVTRDRQAAVQKGRRPYFKEKERLAMVAALKGVDAAVLGDASKKWRVVEKLRPHVICVGYDQRADHPAFLAQLATFEERPKIVRLKAHRPDRNKSSKIRK